MVPSRPQALHHLQAASPNLRTSSRAPRRPTPSRNPGQRAPRLWPRPLPRPRGLIRPPSRPQLRPEPARPPLRGAHRYLRRHPRRRVAPPHLSPLLPLHQLPSTLRQSRRHLHLHRLSPSLLQCNSQFFSQRSSQLFSRAARSLRPRAHEVRHHHALLGLPDPLRQQLACSRRPRP